MAAILTPVFIKAKFESKVGAAKLNLKGFWQGLTLYQSDYDPKLEYGSVEDMGLPSVHDGWLNFVNQYTGDFTNGFQTKQQFLPCGQLDRAGMESVGLFYMANNLSDWPKNVEKYRENTVIIFDGNCNSGGTKWLSQKMQKRSIGVALSGKLRDKSHRELIAVDQRFYQ